MSNSQDLEARITELETKFSFDEYTIEQLSGELASQQMEMEKMKREIRFLHGKLKDVVGSNVALPSEETPPPHY